MAEREFKVGDLVQVIRLVKAPVMLVEDPSHPAGYGVGCVWFVDHDLRRACFKPETLEHVDL